MEEWKEKVGIGILALAFIPALIFLVLMVGKIAQVERPVKPELQATETVAVTQATAETEAPTLPETTPPTETLPPETQPEETVAKLVYDQVPEYFQGDYAHIRYSRTNIAQSGSVVVSLSMVASYLTNHEYLPDEMMELFDHLIGSSMEWLEEASDILQLPWTRVYKPLDALEAVHQGKIVIALMNAASPFSDGYHYIVLRGVNEEGRIVVNDPNKSHYTKWGLAEGFQAGFEDKQFTYGFSGAWVYDPEAMPEDPFIYEGLEPVECRYPGVELTAWETELLAKLIWGEAQGEPYEGQQAVAEVVLNRLVSGNFQSNIHDIIYAKEQFESAPNLDLADPTHVQYEAIERALYGPYILPIDVVFFATFRMNNNVWGDIGNHTFCYAYD